jgi:hypothetical protein
MNSPQGLENFDVLTSQVGDGYTHKVPIHKIGESPFNKVVQPTEILPNSNDESEEVNTKIESSEDFSVPKALLDYLDTLIVKKKLPLRTLRFDIEFSKSKQEVAGHLQTQAEKIGNIETEDLDKLFGFIGYGRQSDESQSFSHKENIEDSIVPEAQIETQGTEVPIEVREEVVESAPTVDLTGLRQEFSKLKIEHRRKLGNDKTVYKRMMSGLGADREMPVRPEPQELVDIRNEYITARRKANLSLEGNLQESQSLIDAEAELLSESSRARISKALSLIDYYPNISQFGEAIMLADSSSVEKIIDPVSYDGMRVEGEAVQPEVQALEIQQTEPEKVTVVEPEPEIVKNIEQQSAEVVEEPVLSPVDSTIAETSPLAQNVFPTDFDGKKLEVMHSFPDNANQIKVFYDGKEIAVGEATKKGGVVKIKKEYKSGFLLAATIEEKALKHAQTIIKTLKSV